VTSASILKTTTKLIMPSLFIVEHAKEKVKLSILICTARIALNLLIKDVLLAQASDAQYANTQV